MNLAMIRWIKSSLFKNDNINDLKKRIKDFLINRNNKNISNKIQNGFKNLNRFDENDNLQKYYDEIISL